MTALTAAELAGFERVERRCRVCRDPDVRRLVDHLLDWRGTPIIGSRGKAQVVTYTDILRWLAPLNEAREKGQRITYDSVWNHANRHYGLAGIVAYWRGPVIREVVNALREKEV
jgi:hypothetical protein